MKKQILFVLVIIVFLGGCSKPIHAGNYEIVKGKGIEVCDTYFEYLKTEKFPLMCERNFPPDVLELKRPDWKKLDNDQNKLLILRIENYLKIPKDEKSMQAWNPPYKEEDIARFNVNSPGRLLYTANIDINNDGKKELLAKYRSFHCHEYYNPVKAPHWKAPIVVLNDDNSKIDIKKTYPLMQNQFKVFVSNVNEINERNKKFFQLLKKGLPYAERIKMVPVIKSQMKPTKYAAGITERQGYDVFEFNNERYFDKWDEERRDKNYQSLTVYKNNKSKTNSICRYQYSTK